MLLEMTMIRRMGTARTEVVVGHLKEVMIGSDLLVPIKEREAALITVKVLVLLEEKGEVLIMVVNLAPLTVRHGEQAQTMAEVLAAVLVEGRDLFLGAGAAAAAAAATAAATAAAEAHIEGRWSAEAMAVTVVPAHMKNQRRDLTTVLITTRAPAGERKALKMVVSPFQTVTGMLLAMLL